VEFDIGYVYENVNKIQIWLKSAKDFGHFTRTHFMVVGDTNSP